MPRAEGAERTECLLLAQWPLQKRCTTQGWASAASTARRRWWTPRRPLPPCCLLADGPLTGHAAPAQCLQRAWRPWGAWRSKPPPRVSAHWLFCGAVLNQANARSRNLQAAMLEGALYAAGSFTSGRSVGGNPCELIAWIEAQSMQAADVGQQGLEATARQPPVCCHALVPLLRWPLIIALSSIACVVCSCRDRCEKTT